MNNIEIQKTKQKINDINYDYKIIKSKINQLMKDEKIIDLGEKSINVFGFEFNLDFVSDTIELDTLSVISDLCLKTLNNLCISTNNFRLKIYMRPIYDDKINRNIIENKDNKNLKLLLKQIYNKLDKIIIFGKEYENVDENLFIYLSILSTSIIEDSFFILLDHQIQIEIIELENNLNYLPNSENDVIGEIIKLLNKINH